MRCSNKATMLVLYTAICLLATVAHAATVTSVSTSTGSFVGAAMTVTGTGFASGCIVQLGSSGTYASATLTNCNGNAAALPTSMTCVTPLLSSGTYYLYVLCAGTAQTTSSVTFVPTAPTITAISPTTLVSTFAGTTLTLTGTNFGCGCTVALSTSSSSATTGALTCSSPTAAFPTSMTCSTPGLAYPQTYYAWVTCGSSTTSSAQSFATGTTTVTASSPATGSVTAGFVTISGTNFGTGCTVNFDTSSSTVTGTAAGTIAATSVIVVSSQSITAYTGTMVSGTGYYAWVTCPGLSAVTGATPANVIYTPGIPTVASVSVNGLTTGAFVTVPVGAAQTVSITGTNFGSTCTASLSTATASSSTGAVSCTSTTYVSATVLKCLLPTTLTATPTTAYYPWVTCGSSINAASSTPTITPTGSFTVTTHTPTTGSAIGEALTITGTNLGSYCTVSLSTSQTSLTSAVACTIKSLSDTQIVAITGSVTAGIDYYTWVTCGSESYPGTSKFTAGAPTVASMATKGAGTATSMTSDLNAAQTVILTGTNYGIGCTVTFSTSASSASSSAKPCLSPRLLTTATLSCILDPTMTPQKYYAYVTCGTSAMTAATADLTPTALNSVAAASQTLTTTTTGAALGATVTVTANAALFGTDCTVTLSIANPSTASANNIACQMTSVTATEFVCVAGALTVGTDVYRPYVACTLGATRTTGNGIGAIGVPTVTSSDVSATKIGAGAYITLTGTKFGAVAVTSSALTTGCSVVVTTSATDATTGALTCTSPTCLTQTTIGCYLPTTLSVATYYPWVTCGSSTNAATNVVTIVVTRQLRSSVTYSGNYNILPGSLISFSSWHQLYSGCRLSFSTSSTSSSGALACNNYNLNEHASAPTMTCTTPALVAGTYYAYATCANNVYEAPTSTFTTISAASPALVSVSPSAWGAAGGQTVTVTASGTLTNTMTVTVCGTPAGTLSSGTFTTPALSVGNCQVFIQESNVNIAGSASVQILAPILISATPSSLPVTTASGQSVAIVGNYFSTGCTASIGGTACTSSSVASATSILCTTPSISAGTNIVAVTCNSLTSNTTTLTAIATSSSTVALTTVAVNGSTSAVPLQVSLAGSPILISGTGFAPSGCTATVGGTICTSPSYASSTSMTCVTPTALAAGVYPVVVTCNSFVSIGNTFVNASGPSVTLVSPLTTALIGTPLTVIGTNFGTGCTVGLTPPGGSLTACLSPTWTSPTTMSCSTPALSAADGIVVSVTCNSVASTGSSIFFTAAVPTLTGASPSTISLAGTTLTVTGTNFGSGCSVGLTPAGGSFTDCPATYVSSTTLTCVTPALSAASGIVVSVTCNSQKTTATSVTVTAAAPTVSSASPSTIAMVGSLLTVTGTNFGASCTIGLTPPSQALVACSSPTYVSSTSMTCTTPPLSAGSSIAVTVTCNGVSSGASSTVTAAIPTVTSATTSGGSGTVMAFVPTAVTVKGTNFGAGCLIKLNYTVPTTLVTTSSPCTQSVYISDTTMYCLAPGAAPFFNAITGVVVYAICNNGFSTSTSVTLSTAAPTITGIAVDSATAATTATGSPAGSALTVTGTNFGASGCVVGFKTWCSNVACSSSADSALNSPTTYSATSLTIAAASMPSLPIGAYLVQVTCGAGTSPTTTSTSIIYTVAVPTLASISPTTFAATLLGTGANYLTLTGTNFGKQCTIALGSSSCTPVTYVSATTLTCPPPSMTATTAQTVVVTCLNTLTTATIVTVVPSTPTVTAATPSAISLAGGSYVSVSGTNFAPGCTVYLNSVTCLYSGYISPSQMTCATPASSSTSTLDLPASVTCGTTSSTVSTSIKTISGAPSVTAAVPALITTAAYQTVNITGTNFGQAGSTGCTATINSIACLYTTVASATSIICHTPSTLTAVTAGAVVVTCNSQASNSTVTIGIGAPTLSAISPTAISSAGGIITVTGTNFASGCVVQFGSSSVVCSSYTYTGSGTITCTAPAISSLTAQIVTVMCGAVSTTATTVTITPTAPTVLSATPATISVAATTVSVTGTYFYSGCYVSLGGTACGTFTYISATSMTCITPTTLSPASLAVTVTCNGNTSPSTGTTVPLVKVAPTVTSVSPTLISTVGGQTVTVYGTGLSSSCTVTVGGNACTSPSSSVPTTLTCVSPAFSTAGSVAVLVTCNSIDSTESVRATVVGPTVSGVTSSALITQAGGQTATITGTGYQAGCTATIGGITCSSPTVAGSLTNGVYSSLTCTTPALTGTSALQVQVSCGTVKSSETFVTVTPSSGANPTATSLTTTNPMSTYGGANITITGTGFGTGCTVSVGTAGACTNVLVASSGQLQCTAPAAIPAGSQNVIVSCGAATPTTAIAVTYVAPIVTSASSLNISTAGGFNATINGTGFISGCSVTVNGAACSGVVVASANSLSCIAPSLASGAQAVVVSCGVSSSSNITLAYAAPTISSLAPSIASTVGGSVIMINGTGFGSTCTFTVGGTPCAYTTFVSSTLMSCTVPALTVGTAVVVAQCGGTITGFTSSNTTGATLTIAPTVSTVTSNALVTATGGATLTVNGAGFVSGCSIVLGTAACTSSFSSTTQLTCVAPVLPAGPHAAMVTCNNVSAIGRAVTIVYPSDNTTSPVVTNATLSVISAVGGTIYIGGTNFAAGCTATIGGTSCANLVALSSTLVTCTAAAPAAAGSASVQVTCGTKTSNNNTVVTFGAPTASSISPSTVTTAAGSLMSITGTNLATGCTVTVGGLACTAPTAVSSTMLNCTTPLTQIGTAAVVVKCGALMATGLSVTVATYVKPTVTGVSVATSGSPVITAGATTVPITVSGSGFAAGCTVSVGAASCGTVTVASSTSLTCIYPARASGNQVVAVTCGTFSSDITGSAVYVVSGNVPTVASVSPSTLSTAGAAITISGTFYATGCSVTVGGFACASPLATSSTTITCTAPELAPGLQAVVVTCGSASVDKVYVTYVSPTVVTATAAAPAAMSPTALITVNGTNFASGCTVMIGYVACASPTFTATLITCSLPAPLVAGQQAAVVTCGTISAVSTISLSVPPQLMAIQAWSAITSAGNIMQIVGAGFPSTTCTAYVNNVACFSTTYHSAEVLNCTVPSASVGSQNVTVTCGLVPSIDKVIAVYGPVSVAPQVMYLSTPSPLYMNGSLTVTINGTSFATGCSVSVNGSACIVPNTWSPSAISCTVPAVANSGTASVIVTCSGNSNTMPITYGNYFDAPVVSTVNSVGTVTSVGTGGGNITINGTGFATGCVARVANSTCTLPATSSPRTMTCVAPANDVGSQSVAVICGNVTSNTNVTLSYVLPTLSSIAPTSISTLGNVSVTITGTGFGPFCSVAIAGKACNTTQAITVTTIVCLAPANAAGSQKVSVTCGSYVAEDLKLTYMTPIASPPPPGVASPPGSNITGTNTFGQTEERKSMDLVFAGLDYTTMTSTSLLSFDLLSEAGVCTSLGLSSFQCDGTARAARRKLLAGSIGTTMSVQFADGTSQDSMRTSMAALVNNINSNFRVVFADLLKQFPTITGVSARDVSSYDYGSNDDNKKKNLAIGLGVGLGVGIPLIAAIVSFCIWKSKRSAAGVVAPRGDGSA